MPWWKNNPSTNSPSSSSSSSASPSPKARKDLTSAFSRKSADSVHPRLTRQRKLRHVTDIKVGDGGGGGVGASPTRNCSSPLPLPLPGANSPGFRLPSPTVRDESGDWPVMASTDALGSLIMMLAKLSLNCLGCQNEDARSICSRREPNFRYLENGNRKNELALQSSKAKIWVRRKIIYRPSDLYSSLFYSNRLPYQAARNSADRNEAPPNKSMFSYYRKALHDPTSVVGENFRLNIPAKSAPSVVGENFRHNIPAKSAPPSGFSSPAHSPKRMSSIDYLASCNIPQGVQVWSAPELPANNFLTGFSTQSSPEIYLSSSDHSSLYSPSPKSPVLRSRNTSAPPSPLHHNNNGNANVHPLPLPPQTGSVHSSATKVEASPWQKQKLIGSGTFGNVYVATNKHTGALCAMKEVNIIPDDPKSAECLQQLEQEIKVLSQLKHPNIVQYYGSEMTEDHFYIFLEYVYPGSINKYVRDHCGAMTESVVRNFTRHILRGLAYLHGTKNIHRDIKGANLLVDINGVVKLADFGMAKHLSEAAGALSLRGTPYWMAPEVVQATMNKDIGYDYAIDIWSLGCTIIEMFTGKHPWTGLEGAAAMFKVLHKDPPIPDTLSSEGKDFLQRCFRRNPTERPTAVVLLDHPFVRNFHDHQMHGSINDFAGLQIVNNTYSPRDRPKVRSETGVRGRKSSPHG